MKKAYDNGILQKFRCHLLFIWNVTGILHEFLDVEKSIWQRNSSKNFNEEIWGLLFFSDLYETAEKVPNLELLQSYRLDDLNCSKLYSNPGMFFDIWKEEVIEKAKKEAKALRKKNKKREKQNIRKELQAGDLVKIETRNVIFFIK